MGGFYLFNLGIKRFPTSSLQNTITTIAGVIALTIIAATADQSVIQVKDNNGKLTYEVTSSGSVNMSGSLKVTGSIRGAGLTSCSNATTSKLLWDSGTGLFSCGTDQAGSGGGGGAGTGSLQTQFDNRYVNTSGDTMTGALIVKASISGSSLYSATSIQGSGLVDCATVGTSKLLWTAATGRFSCGTDTNTTYTAGQGLTLAGTSFKLNASNTGALSNYLTQSGSTVYAKTTLASSGSLKVLGNMSGGSLNINNLKSCVHTKTDAAGLFSCDQSVFLTADQTQAGQGLTLTTNSLKVNASLSGTLIRFTTVSGSTVTANVSLSSSGTLAVKGIARFQNNVNVVGTLSGAALTIMNGASYIFGNTTIGASASADTKLEVIGTISGSIVYANTALRSSGSIVAEGAISGASLYIGNSLQGLGLVTCSNTTTSKLLWTAATGKFSCGTDQTGSTGAAQGLTVIGTSLQLSSTISGTLLKFQTVSGSTIIATRSLSSSGVIVSEGNISGATLNIGGAVRGGSLVILNGASSILANLTIGSANAAHTKLEVFGTISGSYLNISNNIAASGSLVAEGANYIQHDVIIPLCDAATACAAGSGSSFIVRGTLSGATITNIYMDAAYTGTTGTMTVQLRNITRAVDILSTKVQLDSAEPSSDTAATPAVIGNATLKFGDIIVPFIAAVHTTPAKGVSITLHTKPQ